MPKARKKKRFDPRQRHLFDESFPIDERLPRHFRIEFTELDNEEPTVVLFRDGEQVGDPLTNNSYTDDGYRYHDVFHFANAAILGWSPMARKLLDCKRKSDPQTSVIEDGGRAKVIEEVVCALIYDYGLQRNFQVHHAEIDDEFVNMLRRITADREISELRDENWKQLIAESLATWKMVWDHRGGTLEGNLYERRITFTARSEEQSLEPIS